MEGALVRGLVAQVEDELALVAGLWTNPSSCGGQSESFPGEFQAEGCEESGVFDHFFA